MVVVCCVGSVSQGTSAVELEGLTKICTYDTVPVCPIFKGGYHGTITKS